MPHCKEPTKVQRTILLIQVLFACSLSFGQARKSLNDTTFIKGDTLIVPELIFGLSHPMRRETNDSLDLVIDFLSKHPELTVELAFHTDSRGSMEMNEKLSNHRAKHACNYIYSNSQHQSFRVECIGYGERHLLITEKEIELANSVEEKERMHGQNRRTELIIKEVK